MNDQNIDPNSQLSTIGVDLVHPSGLNRQDAVEWVKQDMKKAQPDFSVKYDPESDEESWPHFNVSGEHQALKNWFCINTGSGAAADFEEWVQPYQANKHV